MPLDPHLQAMMALVGYVGRPAGPRTTRRPTIVFFYGGGFVIGDLDTHDDVCRRRCREAEGYLLNGDDLRWFPTHYLGANRDHRDRDVRSAP